MIESNIYLEMILHTNLDLTTRSVLFSLDRLFLRIIETFAAADSLCRAYFRTIGGILLFSMDSRLARRGQGPAGAVCLLGLSAINTASPRNGNIWS